MHFWFNIQIAVSSLQHTKREKTGILGSWRTLCKSLNLGTFSSISQIFHYFIRGLETAPYFCHQGSFFLWYNQSFCNLFRSSLCNLHFFFLLKKMKLQMTLTSKPLKIYFLILLTNKTIYKISEYLIGHLLSNSLGGNIYISPFGL